MIRRVRAAPDDKEGEGSTKGGRLPHQVEMRRQWKAPPGGEQCRPDQFGGLDAT